MAKLIQKISIDVRNIESMKSLMVVLGKEYENLPDAVKSALEPLMTKSEPEHRKGGSIPNGQAYRVGECPR